MKCRGHCIARLGAGKAQKAGRGCGAISETSLPGGATKRTEITIETDRIVVIRGRKVSGSLWCAACAKRSRMVLSEEAATIGRVSSRTVYRWVEAGRVHFFETAEGSLLIFARIRLC